jgi:YrbI family 3-deoxy-D-manno-octulosonate 8-phosphate phosphatase|tara:strand:- start:4667 stop:5170 length:504 start_codon:yes stop_codon:yes gene_type:complete
MNSSNLSKKCKQIKLVISDVDGVLTDGGMYYSSKGEIMKKFNVKDGMGVELLKQNNIKTILMTKEKSDIVIKRGKKIKADATLIGITKKEKKLDEICRKFNVNKSNIGYIGDDINDHNAMKLIGLSASPLDAEQKIHNISDYVCEKKGGDGAFREFVNMIIEKRGKN